MERVAVVAAAIIAAGCGTSQDLTGLGSEPLSSPLTIKLSDYPSLATIGLPVEIKNSTGGTAGIAAVKTGTATFIALGMACTHEGTKVNITGNSFTCPNHGARFTNSGAVTLGPATRPLSSRTVSYDSANGTLTFT
jgi:cytochrome b6-f complex iron-sulfur subunit